MLEAPFQHGRLHFRVPRTDIQLWLIQATHGAVLPASGPLLHSWLAELTGLPAASLDLARSPEGKPWLRNHSLQFNLSHSRDAVVLAWHDSRVPLGVDIEHREREAAFTALARRYFHPCELRDWQQAPLHMQDETWLAIWTRKEAVLKAQGMGLRADLKGINTTQNPVILEATQQRFRRHTLLTDHHILSVAWQD